MKKATTILYNDLQSKSLIHGKDWGFCVFCHDEWQVLTRQDFSKTIANTAVKSIQGAGNYFKLKCEFTGEYRIGKNWMETH